MTHDELIDLGKLIRAVEDNSGNIRTLREAIGTLADKINKLSETVRHLPCLEADTDPDCPVAISQPPQRERLMSASDDEPDSVLTRQLSTHAGPLAFRGPGIMVAIIVLLGGPLCVATYVLAMRWFVWH